MIPGKHTRICWLLFLPSNLLKPISPKTNKSWLRLTMDLPGVLAKDLDVSIERGILSVQGCRRTMSLDGTVCLKKYKFHRRFAIETQVVSVSESQAGLVNGVFTFKAPKTKSNGDASYRIEVTDTSSNASKLSSVQETRSLGGPPFALTREPLPGESRLQTLSDATSTVSQLTDDEEESQC